MMARDLYLELEAALRRPARQLLIDELLPAAEKIPSSVPVEAVVASPPAAGAGGEEVPVVGNLRETLERLTAAEAEPVEAPPAAKPAPATTRHTAAHAPDRRKRIEDEVQEFLALQRSRGVRGSPGIEKGDDVEPDRDGTGGAPADPDRSDTSS